MKKVFDYKKVVAIFAASTLFACTQDFTNEFAQVENKQEESTAMKALPKRRTYEEALTIAQDAIGMLGESSATRSGKPRTVNIDDVQYIVNSSSTRSTDAPDTLMYVFNYEDNAGFAVVSANRATEELIAVTEQGNYTVGEETENGGFNMYMDMAETYVTRSFSPDTLHSFITRNFDRILYSYGPYVNVRWGQRSPYNQYCLHNDTAIAAGCLTTALAQVISYYEYPTQLTIDYDGGHSQLALNWSEIKKHKSPTLCTCSEHVTIAKMFRQLGEELEIPYHDGISGNGGSYIDDALSVLGYTYGSQQAYSQSVVESSLSQGKLIYITGYTAFEGHAWVIDGFKKVETTTVEYVRNESTGLMIEVGRRTSTKCYNHLNWGWNGDSNGYFLCNVFNTRNSSQLDLGVSSNANFNFTYNIRIYPYIAH